MIFLIMLIKKLNMSNKVYKKTKSWKWSKESKERFSEYCKQIKRRPPTRKGIPNTEQQKEKIRKTWKKIIEMNGGKHPYVKPMYGEDNPSKRKDVREKISQKLKIASLERFKNKENHPRWLGGKSFEDYGFNWTKTLKKSIRQRDNYICQECGIHQNNLIGRLKRLDVHHIDYNKKNCSPNNLISLCRQCHAKTGINRDYWKQLFTDKNYKPLSNEK